MTDRGFFTKEDWRTRYPWPSALLVAKPLEWLWRFELSCGRMELFALLADTSRFNRALGLGQMEFEERDGALFGSSKNGGVVHEWREIPWNWVWGRELIAERAYSRGFAKHVRVIYRLEEDGDGGTVLYVYFGWIPRSFLGRQALRMGHRFLRKGYRRVLEELVEKNARTPEVLFEVKPPPLGADAEQRLSVIQEQLVKDWNVEAELAARLAHLVREADPLDLHRIQVRRLAREWGVEERDLLVACMTATRVGLLELSWDLVCPHCRGVREETASLGNVESRGTCDVCDIDFDTGGENAIEITFRVHSSIREVPEIFYCSAEPAHKRHIKLQRVLSPAQTDTVTVELAPGLYRLRARGHEDTLQLDVVEGREEETVAWTLPQGASHARVGTKANLQLMNGGDQQTMVVLEELGWADTALRPRDVFSLQEFRDLFSEEYIDADVRIHVGEQTLLFTDMVGSTRFYAEKGDPGAFAEVKRHFGVIQEVLREHGGAMVKSIGDAVMAAFNSPLEAVRASREILRRFPENEAGNALRLRASLNAGPCIAVNLNTGIDYFGGTVNLAAKLQAVAEAGDLAISQSVWHAPGVKEFLTEESANIESGVLETQAGPVAYGVWHTDIPVPRATGSHADTTTTL